MLSKKRLLLTLLGFVLLVLGASAVQRLLKSAPSVDKRVRVLSYSSFLNAWGPGPEIAKRFSAETGIEVELLDAGDAGLILKKMELFSSDVVIGLDQISTLQARSERKWREFQSVPDDLQFREPEFLPFDWGPLTFIYRKGEVEPPQSFEDLLKSSYKNAISLQDPRTSTPGLQFLFWVLDEMGEDEGFEYLAKLKPNVHSVSASWSSAYGLFTKRHSKLTFSYLTSPVYHWIEENDKSYQSASFTSGHPVQIEYAAVPESCMNCEAGEQFALFLIRPEIQKIIMEKNYMLPVVNLVAHGTLFEANNQLPELKLRQWKSLPHLLQKRDALFERWRKLGL